MNRKNFLVLFVTNNFINSIRINFINSISPISQSPHYKYNL